MLEMHNIFLADTTMKLIFSEFEKKVVLSYK